LLTACPKRMAHGPCGGVARSGACEVDPDPCVFLDRPTVVWGGPTPVAPAAPPAPAGLRALLARRQVVIADLAALPLDAASLAQGAHVVRGAVDAVLLGDSPRSRVQLPPAYRAMLVQQAGVAAWPGLTCRDRNRVALEGELAALAHLGVAGVHCVTGDHPLTGSRPDATAVFDLDSTQVAALAASAGHLVSVGESPASPPVGRRAARLREKERAGAQLCFVNHAGGLGFIPCVPVVVDRESADLLRSFTSLVLPDDFLERILGARDPTEEGVAAALELAAALLGLDGVVGVNLSGGSGPGSEQHYNQAFAAIGRALVPHLKEHQ